MQHLPVLLEEVIAALKIKKGGIYLDGTVGYGGHAQAILEKGGKVIGIDRDQQAIEYTQKKLPEVELYQGSYADIDNILEEQSVDGILLDLGASSPQFDQAERGFSFKADGPLDMRFDVNGTKKTAADILNTYQQPRLEKIIREYGQERFAKKIAKAIVNNRKTKKFARTDDLRQLIEKVIPRRAWPPAIHPATRTFQALRIEVNQELDQLEEALPKLVDRLKKGGRIVVISFHSLEDRIVKHFYKLAEKSCVCPLEFPECRCDKQPTLQIVTKKPITATKTEIKQNARSRSAKMRVAERI